MPAADRQRDPLPKIAGLFARLGLIAFGGPAAHIALMEEEFVERRRWLSRQHFLDLVGATNLIPGPNSTEMTMHLGYERGGVAGLLAAGAAFIVPSALLTGVLAWAYVAYGELPAVEPLLAGVKPAVVVVIAGALWRLGRKALEGWRAAIVAAATLTAAVSGVPAIWALLGGGVAGMFFLQASAGRGGAAAALLLLQAAKPASAGAVAVGPSLAQIGLFFAKVGAVLYGSGYVLIAFLEQDLVDRYGWLTEAQLLDAVALGQFTPGPVSTTATFIGYLLAGPSGAAVATAAFFLPSFFFVLLLNPLIPRLRNSEWTGAFLDAVNAAAVALMAFVAFELARAALVDWVAWTVAGAAAGGFFLLRLNPAWIILGGGALGWLLAAVARP